MSLCDDSQQLMLALSDALIVQAELMSYAHSADFSETVSGLLAGYSFVKLVIA